MGELSAILRDGEGGRIRFRCPGCKDVHDVRVGGSHPWTWNGDVERPTFQPSILVRSGHYASHFNGSCWCTYNAEHPDDPVSFKCAICHSFVTDGQIQFLNDCTHELAGKTVPLPPFDAEIPQ